jgi:hypothetical protein
LFCNFKFIVLMKKSGFFIVVLVLLFLSNGSQAQIWNQIQNAAEKEALKKASQKGQKEIDKGVSQNANAQDAILSYGKNKVDVSAVPDSYTFSWKYIMEIKSDEGKAMNAEYFLEPNASYFGFNMGQGQEQSMFMIMDNKNKLTVTCFGNGKEKMASASKISDYSEMVKKEKGKSIFTYKTLPDKTFLGYKCKGIEATNADYVMVFYFTTEAKVSFGDLFKNQNMPDAFSSYFKPDDKPLMMDMTMKDLKNKGKTTTMKCVSLDKNSYVFNKSDYQFM